MFYNSKVIRLVNKRINLNRDGYFGMSDNTQVSCPYCASKFNNNEELSKHIDRIHGDSGLLEGDRRQWK